jgi:ABC-type phosphate/phosphonate transport system ATPase subunit
MEGVYRVATPDRLAALAEAARLSAQLAEDDREARDAAIEEADRLGMGIREIARYTRLSPGHVQRIITARTAARQASAQASPAATG